MTVLSFQMNGTITKYKTYLINPSDQVKLKSNFRQKLPRCILIREFWNQKNQYNRYVLAIENDNALLGDGLLNGQFPFIKWI
jgi:hypothetical protein